MNRCLYALGALILIGLSARASAQSYYEQTFGPAQSVRWHLDAGYSPTLGQAARFFDSGFTVGGGTRWQPWPTLPFALRADFDYSRFSATGRFTQRFAQVAQSVAYHGYDELFGLSFDGEYRVRLSPGVRGFALAGVGVAQVSAPLSETVTFSCNPSGAACPSGYPSSFVVPLNGHSTQLSWNAGLGLDFALRDGMTVFVEARYMRLQTAIPFEFVPVTVGLSF